jgi:hypothetical protein
MRLRPIDQLKQRLFDETDGIKFSKLKEKLLKNHTSRPQPRYLLTGKRLQMK